LWSIDADGGGLRQLTNEPVRQLIHPVPSRDGARAAAAEGYVRQVLIYDARDF
jgi:hypothetical protein